VLFGVVPVGIADEAALESEAEFEGGVRSWPRLTGGGMP
jgi:hypothetical protein